MKKGLRQLIRSARGFMQPINHDTEPEALRLAHEKRALERELRAQGYGRRAAMIEASRRLGGDAQS